MSPHYFESSIKVGFVKSFPVRSTLLPYQGGAVLISPIKFDAQQIAQLKQFTVTDIVAPSDIHHLFVLDAQKIFPKARLWRVPGLEKKRSDVNWTHVLGESAWPIDEIKWTKIEGAPRLNEHVFFHQPSKTLVVTDLLFNITQPEGLAAKIVFTIGGTNNGLAMSRLWKVMVKDKTAFETSLKKIMQWDFDKVALAHGANVFSDGKRLLKGCAFERGYKI